MKIVTILGARPQFIKAGAVSREVLRQAENGKNIKEIIVHTGQHYDANMSDVFFDEMQIPKPQYSLGIGGLSHGEMTGQMIEKIEKILIKEQPDCLLVYGDTNSTLAGSIAASKLGIKIAHVEAGLRSFNMAMPEEINRIVTDRLSSWLFCPTQIAVDNLVKEGITQWQTDAKATLSGDVMRDNALFYSDFARQPQNLAVKKEFVLCTIHRAENTDNLDNITNIVSALNESAKMKQVILPLHPRTKKILETYKLELKDITVIDPVGYLEMVWLLKNCDMVLTDSGGLQKEAYFFAKPCITMRSETEWLELVEHGFNYLSGANKEKILALFKDADFSSDFNKNLYGAGNASEHIITELLNDN